MSWLPVSVTVEPTDEPMTLEQAKSQCRVDGADDNALLTSLITAARKTVEESCGIKIMAQTVQAKCSVWWDLENLPTAPIQSITSIEYLDLNGVLQTLDPTIYQPVLEGLAPSIRLNINQWWPPLLGLVGPYNYFPDAITVTAVAGYSTTPAPLVQAMMFMVSQWYDERSSLPSGRYSTVETGIATLPFTTEALLTNYRRL